ncbi:ribonuclease H family protein, partial [Salmonella sp. S090_02723]|uniref:ribonuclease H family protein n=2 Tax=unclassified Salmonella TaxID=2614656 RepID=UPI0039772EBE
MDPAKVQAVAEWVQPASLKALQCFLGFANYYRRFIANFSVIAKPLTDLTRKGADLLHWPPEAVQAFEVLKKCFISAPVLVQPNQMEPFIVEVDASEVGVGAVLSQGTRSLTHLRPCAYFSR